jgi:hypothetical protein
MGDHSISVAQETSKMKGLVQEDGEKIQLERTKYKFINFWFCLQKNCTGSSFLIQFHFQEWTSDIASRHP